MSENEQPRNRKERRAAAKASGKKFEPFTNSSPDIPLAQPDRSGPKGKTLYEIADERHAQMVKEGKIPASSTSTAAAQAGGREDPTSIFFGDSEPLSPLGEAVFFGVTLSMLHFTLDTLVYNQYAQEIDLREITKHTLRIFPMLVVLIWMLHIEWAKRWVLTRQLFFFGISIAAGCYLIYSTNVHGYFYVMKRAPPVGTLWVWSVVEMRPWWALLSVIIDAGYFWWNGYSI